MKKCLISVLFVSLFFLISPYLISNFSAHAFVAPGLTSQGTLTNGTTFGYAPQYGDINGDGYKDLIVSKYDYSSSTGRIYFYFGNGTSFSSTPNLTITGEASSNYFGGLESGSSAIAVADINGDGYDDILTAAPLNGQGGTQAGKIYVFYGSPTISGDIIASSANLSALGNATTKYLFGGSVAIIDTNNDGKNDIVVLAPTNNYTTSSVIYTYLNNNNTFDFNNPSFTLTTTNTYLFVYGGINSGDFDGDGNKDLLIAGWYSASGKLYLFRGLGTGQFIQTTDFDAQNVSDFLGRYRSVAVADINGDGKSDFCVGAYNDSSVASKQGRVYCFFGRSNFASSYSVTQADIILNGQATKDDFGRTTYLYDVTNDGKPDLLVGAYQTDQTAGNKNGKFFIYKNVNGTFSDSPWLSVIQSSGSNGFGVSSSAFDWNYDGWANITVTQSNTTNGTGDPILNYYELSHGSPAITPTLNTSPKTITGTAVDSNSSYEIAGVEWGVSNTTGGTWTSCSPTDGAFDSSSESFSCDVSSVINNSGQSIYVRSFDQNGLYIPPQLFGSVRTLTTAGGSFSTTQVCNNPIPTGKAPWIYQIIPSNTSVTLKFTNWQTPVDHFTLEYGTKSNQYQYAVDNIGNSSTNTYTVNSLKPNTIYYFRVRSGNGCAVGAWSNEVSVKTGITSIKSVTGSTGNATTLQTPTPSQGLYGPEATPTTNIIDTQQPPNLLQQIINFIKNICGNIWK